jgi:hypothetical protein
MGDAHRQFEAHHPTLKWGGNYKTKSKVRCKAMVSAFECLCSLLTFRVDRSYSGKYSVPCPVIASFSLFTLNLLSPPHPLQLTHSTLFPQVNQESAREKHTFVAGATFNARDIPPGFEIHSAGVRRPVAERDRTCRCAVCETAPLPVNVREEYTVASVRNGYLCVLPLMLNSMAPRFEVATTVR